jgi:hypothetical protein
MTCPLDKAYKPYCWSLLHMSLQDKTYTTNQEKQ